MSREIKFRAWDKRDNRMYSVFPNWCFSLDGDIFDRANPLIDLKKVIEVQQYTGLKDKNGVEIYEGDIVGYRDGEWSFDAVVEWGDHGWYMHGIEPVDNFNFDDTPSDVLEVIGNIYENPELLGAK